MLRILSINVVKFSLLLGLALCSHAQQATTENPILPDLALNAANFSSPTFFERQLGSLGGRVVISAGTSERNAVGIPSVNVILRSADNGFERFSREALTNERGIYSFVDLPAGNYIVTVDPEAVKTKFRPIRSSVPAVISRLERTAVDLELVPQRTIIGVVFLDKDGDLRYKEGSDEPVAGALISYNGTFSTTPRNGGYVVYDPPAGRVSFVVSAPGSTCRSHMVLDIAESFSKPRIVNVPLTC